MNNIDEIVMSLDKIKQKFPNGLSSYLETYYEIVSEITNITNLDVLSDRVQNVMYDYGKGGLYELAEELTDKFENLYIGEEWGINLVYFEVLEEFLKNELYEKR